MMTENQKAEVMEAIMVGSDYYTAMLTQEISEAKAKEYLTDPDFMLFIQACVARAKTNLLAKVLKEGGAKGAQWILEKTYPAEYGNGRQPVREQAQIEHVEEVEEEDYDEEDFDYGGDD